MVDPSLQTMSRPLCFRMTPSLWDTQTHMHLIYHKHFILFGMLNVIWVIERRKEGIRDKVIRNTGDQTYLPFLVAPNFPHPLASHPLILFFGLPLQRGPNFTIKINV